MILTNDVENLQKVDYWQVFLGIIIIMVAIIGIATIITKFCDLIGKPIKWVKKNNTDHEDIQLLKERQSNIDTKLDNLCNAMMETMCDRIEQKSKHYINDLGGIPEDEIESFSSLFEAYRRINGNHGAEAKYNYCIKNLPILPVVTKIKE